MFFESVQTNYVEVDGKAQGTRKSVKVQDGVGKKSVERLGEDGKVVNSKTRNLTKDEIENITNSRFIPGLWSNCKLGKCENKTSNKTLKNARKNTRKKTRKNRK
jgi:hypothetical protein